MNKLDYVLVRASTALTLFAVISAIFCGSSYASEEPQAGNRYKIVGPVYLAGVYRNLNNRQLNRQLAVGSLTAVQSTGPEVAFQRKVPIGTIMTIIGPAPKRARLLWFANANRYFVRLDPASTDLPSEIDIHLELYRGIEGSLDGLNPELFGHP